MSHPRVASLYSQSDLRGLDIQIRINALAQVAGQRVRWTPDARGLTDATRYFLSQGVRLHPSWVDPSSSDIAGTMQSQALKKLRDDAKAAQLLADIIMGETLRSHPRGEIGSAADASKDKILSGGSTSKFKAYLLRHLGQRATSELREVGKRRRREDSIDTPTGDDTPIRELPAQDMLELAPDVLASDPMVQRWIEDQIEELPGPDWHKDVALAWLDDPGRRGLQADLARQYGVSAPTIIGVIQKMTKFLTSRLEADRQQQRHWQSLMLRHDIADIHEQFRGDRLASDAPRMVRVAHFLRDLYRQATNEPSAARVAAAWKRSNAFADADSLYLEGELSDRGFGFKKRVEFGGERGDGTQIEVPVYRVYNPETRANVFEIRLLRDEAAGRKQLDLYAMRGQRVSPRPATFKGPMDHKFQQVLDQMVEYHGMT